MPTRMPSNMDTEALLRQVLTSSARLEEQVRGMDSRINGIQTDAREARDAARESAAATKAQDLPAKIAEVRGMVDKLVSDMRSDLVNSITNVKIEFRKYHEDQDDMLNKHNERLENLESARQRMLGAGGAVGWLARYAPLALSFFATVLAILDNLKGHK